MPQLVKPRNFDLLVFYKWKLVILMEVLVTNLTSSENRQQINQIKCGLILITRKV